MIKNLSNTLLVVISIILFVAGLGFGIAGTNVFSVNPKIRKIERLKKDVSKLTESDSTQKYELKMLKQDTSIYVQNIKDLQVVIQGINKQVIDKNKTLKAVEENRLYKVMYIRKPCFGKADTTIVFPKVL